MSCQHDETTNTDLDKNEKNIFFLTSKGRSVLTKSLRR